MQSTSLDTDNPSLARHSLEGPSSATASVPQRRYAELSAESEHNSQSTRSLPPRRYRHVEPAPHSASGTFRLHTPLQRQTGTFKQESSILFVGPRRNGKSSLAVIAATALRRKVVEADDFFFEATGLSQAAYRKAHGVEQHCLRQAELFREMLLQHKEHCVIACDPHVVVGGGRELLQEFSRSHAIINVSRESTTIETSLDAKNQRRLVDAIQKMHSIHHQLCNFEYYNLAEGWRSELQSVSETDSEGVFPHRVYRKSSFQTLQHTKKDLISFLSTALGLNASEGIFHTLQPPDPDLRPDTIALSIPITAVERLNLDLKSLECGQDAVELVMDVTLTLLATSTTAMTCDTIGRSMAIIRRHFSLPILLHLRLDSVEHSELGPDILKSYFALLHLGLRFAPDFLTVDLRSPDHDIRRLVNVRGRTKVIGNYYHPNADDGFWTGVRPNEMYRKASETGCNVVRLYQPAKSTSDNFSCLTFMSQMRSKPDGIPVIAYNLGALGTLSSVLNAILTPVTHPLLQDGNSTADCSIAPTITTREVQQIRYATQTLNPLNFYVFGSDVKYSLSPAVHSVGFAACWMPHTYDERQCDSLDGIYALLRDSKFGGASISMPFKADVVDMVDSLSPSAREIGAVNTILPLRPLIGLNVPNHPFSKYQRNRSGPVTALHGANTDWMGIYACISRYISPANTPTPQTTGVVIGAGGIARAAIYAMARLGVSNIFVLNRTLVHAEALAKHYNSNVGGSRDLRGYDAASNAAHAVKPTIHILNSHDGAWPERYSYPSIVVYTIPTLQAGTYGQRDWRLPEHWLENETGGLLVDVRFSLPSHATISDQPAGFLP
jgi:3-dehydroquinate dehydratase type I